MRFDVATKIFLEEEAGGNKIAFVAADKELSWTGLKTLSDKICETLEKVKVPQGHPVLVYGDKEAFFLAAIFSCYRKNLPFVPLSPDLPPKRIENIIEQSKSSVILICGDYENAPELPVVIRNDFIVVGSASTLNKIADGIAYIIFTSGSSGEPKGVLISNENITTFIKWFTANFQVNEKTIFINQASFLFDISLADFFGALQTGGTAIFNTSQIISDNLFFSRINKYKGSYWNSTPSFVSMFLADKNFNAQNLSSVNQFVLSGENLPVTLVKELRSRFPEARIVNAYGPTETTIFASYTEITNEMLNENTLPVSKFPAENILLENGEIIIAGKQVGKGYLHTLQLSNEKFNTGDLAVLKNNYLYYAGRMDEQIKFNGYRIELNEIKITLEKFDFIACAECLPLEIGGKIKRLLAFAIFKDVEKISTLKEKLSQLLPAYMIPSEIIVVKEFPLSSNFKVDKKKLLNDYLTRQKDNLRGLL
ncbi:MAG TPA: AMP-binding protein [Bacteroidia bacterium]|jgi:D-alanine--poly(phosphoribitol) ligase subunit 1|nr:AMP-binding protein [Bacteroidia bacterium]